MSNQRRTGGIDLISGLPDEILHKILSFVATKSAVMTSVLSRRWTDMWTQVPCLDFSELPHGKEYEQLTQQQKTSYNMFVYHVLSHNSASPLRSLRLHYADNDIILNSWLKLLENRSIERIDISIDISLPKPVTLPQSFLCFEGLVDLQIVGKFSFNYVPTSNLPNLKIVRFIEFQFPHDDEFLKMLTRNCKALQKILISGCTGIDVVLYIDSPSLEILILIGNMTEHSELPPCIVIHCPNLRFLNVEESLLNIKYDTSNFNLLDEATLFLSDNGSALEVLHNVSVVKTLHLDLGHKVLFEDATKLPIFENLSTLRLDSMDIYSIINCAPKLKNLYLNQAMHGVQPFEAQPPPLCLSYLETIIIDSFQGTEDELDLVSYFLERAHVLKGIMIFLTELGREAERIITQKLLELPRSSSICQIKVHFEPVENL